MATSPVRVHVLDNGCRLLLRPTPYKNILALRAGLSWGGRDDSVELAGRSNLMARLLIKGTERRSAYDIVREIESVGGSIKSGAGADNLGLEIQCSEEDWPLALELMADCLYRSNFPEEEFQVERELVRSELRRIEDNKFACTYRAFRRHFFRDHPYAVPTEGDEESLDRLAPAQLAALHGQVLRPDRSVLAIVGNVDESALLERLAELLPARPDIEPAPRAGTQSPPGAGRDSDHELRRDVEQSFLIVGFAAPPAGHPDLAALRLACAILGEGMASRLFSRLRDRDHLAYAVGAQLVAEQEASHLMLFIGTGPATAERALQGMIDEARALCDSEPASAEEFERARRYVLGKYLVGRQTNAALARSITGAELLGLGWQWAEDFPERIQAVSPEQMQEAAARYLTEPATVRLMPRD